jgi:Cu-processing system permease protein
MRPFLVIARLTFRESTRRKIVLTAIILGTIFLLVFSIGFHLIVQSTIFNDNESARNMIQVERNNGIFLAGIYAVSFLSIAMAALLAADTLAGEITSGTIQTVVTKPIHRSDVVLGKWIGFAGLLGAYQLLMSGGIALSVYLQSGYVAPNVVSGILLIYLESLLIMTIALMCSSILSALATGAVVFGLWGLSFIGGWVEQIGAALQSNTAIQVGIVSSLLIPSEALWRRAAYQMQSPISGMLGMSPFGTISVPSPAMIIYAVIYLIVAFLITLRIFGKRDL